MLNIVTTLRQPFKSKIDWSMWNSEILDNNQLLEEYFDIERTAIENGTWMRTSRNYKIFSEVDEMQLEGLKNKLETNVLDPSQISLVERLVNNLEIAKVNSTIYQGTSEQFVQELSINFKNAFPNFDITFRGSTGNKAMRGNLAESTDQNLGSVCTADKRIAIEYGSDRIIQGATDNDLGILELIYNTSTNSFCVDAAKNYWKSIPREYLPEPHNKLKPLNVLLDNTSKIVTTDDIASYLQHQSIDYCIIRNVRDGPSSNEHILIPKEVIFNHRRGNYLKSRWYNNGNFDITDSSIYK